MQHVVLPRKKAPHPRFGRHHDTPDISNGSPQPQACANECPDMPSVSSTRFSKDKNREPAPESESHSARPFLCPQMPRQVLGIVCPSTCKLWGRMGARGHHSVDGPNSAPPKPKNPWNDDSPVNTNEQRLPMVSKWCRISSTHSMSRAKAWHFNPLGPLHPCKTGTCAPVCSSPGLDRMWFLEAILDQCLPHCLPTRSMQPRPSRTRTCFQRSRLAHSATTLGATKNSFQHPD